MRYALVVPVIFSFAICAMSALSDTSAPLNSSTQSTNLSQLKPEPPQLPEWLQIRPDGWGDSAWYEYQQWLIEMRTPIAANREYSNADMATFTAEVELCVGDYEHHLKREWDEKWSEQLVSYERTGGCGCCNEVYTVMGPRAAIEEFPVHPGRRDMYPRYLAQTEID